MDQRLDQARSQAQEDIKFFTSAYGDELKSAYISKLLEPASAPGGDDEGEAEEKQLLERPAEEGAAVEPAPAKTGWLMKRGDVVKNWKKRLFVVQPDYIIKYYEDDSKVAAGKPKGEINLAGYEVHLDPNSRKTSVKQFEAETYGTDASGEYSKYEPFTIECFHKSRRRWLVKCATAEEHAEWGAVLKKCAACVNASALPEGPVREAFAPAIESLQNHNKMWLSTDESKGSEKDVLAYLLTEASWTRFFGPDAFEAVPGPAMAKRKAAQKAYQAVYQAMSAIVKGAFVGIEGLAPTVEKAVAPLESLKGKAAETRASIKDKLSSSLQSAVAPVREKALAPLGAALAKVLLPKVVDAFKATEQSIGAMSTEFTRTFSIGSPQPMVKEHTEETYNKSIAQSINSLVSFIEAGGLLEKVQSFGLGGDAIISKVLEGLERFLGDYKSWAYSMQDDLVDTLGRGIYTYEQELASQAGDAAEAAEVVAENASDVVRAKFRADASPMIVGKLSEFVHGVLSAIALDSLGDQIDGLAAPLEDNIPDVLKDYLSVSDMVKESLDDVAVAVADEATAGLDIAWD
eukprot:m.352897 g.352897  ORF g.352897 m.352897 type:complete len:574 (+) comp16637_c0_seq1:92-1813(+)